MFQSIQFARFLGYNSATKHNEYKFELVDSDFICVVIGAEAAGVTAETDAVIQEYSKRKLNVAANLIRCFQFQEKKYGWSIAKQIAWAEQYQPLLTPEIKTDLQKYLTLI